jgi:regulator of sirC expression with transglutaminase-like and TPR domain
LLLVFAGVEGNAASDPAAAVREIIVAPETASDFARAKLALDTLVDPATDQAAALAEIDAMVATVERMLSTIPAEAAAIDAERMRALQTFLYEPGWWNGEKPYAYDASDPYGRKNGSQLLARYLSTRLGNCVSMPILVAILGERLGLKMTLSTAPLHVLVKWTDQATGKTWNFEATNGGFARDSHYLKEMPMTDAAIANGVYIKALSRQEALALMATTVLEHLVDADRPEEAVAVADVLLEAYPQHVHALVKKGSAYHLLLRREIIQEYPRARDIPPEKRAWADALYRANHEAFEQAEAMGWREPAGYLGFAEPRSPYEGDD